MHIFGIRRPGIRSSVVYAAGAVLLVLGGLYVTGRWLLPGKSGESAAGAAGRSGGTVTWIIAVQTAGPVTRDAELVRAGLAAALQHVRAGDRLVIIPYSDAALPAPEQTVSDRAREATSALDRVGTAPGPGKVRVSVGLGALAEAARTRPGATVFVLATDGRSVVPGSEHETEMRAVADAAGELRATGKPMLVLGVVTHRVSHWRLAQLQKQCGGELVLLRSSKDLLQPRVLAAIGRPIQAAREVARPEHSWRPGWLAIGIGATLVVLLVLLRSWRRRSPRTRKPVRGDVRPGRTPLTGVGLRLVVDRGAATWGESPADGANPVEFNSRPVAAIAKPRQIVISSPELAAMGYQVTIGSGLDTYLRLDGDTILPRHAVLVVRDAGISLVLEPGARVACFGEQIVGPASRSFSLPSLSLAFGPDRVNVALTMET